MYKRVLLKLSGEALMEKGKGNPVNPAFLSYLAEEIKVLVENSVDVAVVVGGGNIYRGMRDGEKSGIDRVDGDYMGMMATVINSLALKSAFENRGVKARVMSAIPINTIAEPYIRGKALKHLDKKRVVIFAAGTGNPFFTTDTAAALRASEINANLLIKATRVDGLFSKDPEKYEDAEFIDRITYREAINRGLKIMDTSAISLCEENGIPVKIINIHKSRNILNAVKGENGGSYIYTENK
ncbi:MAG: UMP kinase [bacterium]